MIAAPAASARGAEFEITVPRGPMVCGYCGETVDFAGVMGSGEVTPGPFLVAGSLELTGFHSLGVGPRGELVALAEATWLGGRRDCLPHLCEQIPASVYEKYAADIAAAAGEPS